MRRFPVAILIPPALCLICSGWHKALITIATVAFALCWDPVTSVILATRAGLKIAGCPAYTY
jgi:hypothetical protein